MLWRFFLVALLAFLANGQEVWTVQPQGMDVYSIQNAGSPAAIYTANTSTILSNAAGFYWYGSPPNATASQAGSKPPGTDSVLNVAPLVYEATISTMYPAVIYYGGPGGAISFVCNATVFNEFACVSGGMLIADFAAIGTENPDTQPVLLLPVSVNLNTSHPQINNLRPYLQGLLMYRAQKLRSFYDNGETALTNNVNRLNAAQTWGGGVMFLVAAAMESVLIITVTMHSWTFYIRRFSKSLNFIVWLFIFFCAQQLISILGGFPGWFAMFAVLCLYCIILGIVYACLRKKQQKQFPDGKSTKDTVVPGSNGVTRIVPIGTADLESGGGVGAAAASGAPKWACRPDEMGSSQKAILIILTLAVVFLMAICVIIFYTWTPMDYLVWDRYAAASTVEFAPATVDKSTLLMYMYPRMATLMQFNTFCIYSTKFCGYYFNLTLSTPDQQMAQIYTNFIQLYGINMNQYARPSYTQYVTVNDWFTRALAPGARPIADQFNPYLAVSPTDCRMMVFENINSDLHVWLKGEEFDPVALLGMSSAIASVFSGGTMIVARLAPADYHRFHSPVNAQVNTWTSIPNTIFSVNADAARSGNKVYFNTRFTTIFQSSQFGQVGYVAIGATCVGSVIVEAQNQVVNKGDEIGVMQFGGSTVVLLFQPGAIQLDNDLLFNSRRSMETLMLMGQRIGVALP